MTWSLSVSRLKIQFHLRLQVWHAVAMARPWAATTTAEARCWKNEEAFGLKIPYQNISKYSKKNKIYRNIAKMLTFLLFRARASDLYGITALKGPRRKVELSASVDMFSTWCNSTATGWWYTMVYRTTPLKNHGVRQLGWWHVHGTS